MSQALRHPQILELARREGRVAVEDLADRFGVTLQTIRRDLADLSDAGRLERVHGGAVLPSGTSNIGYAERRELNRSAKAAMAQVVAAQVPAGASLFLNIGTSTEAVAQGLIHHKGLLVVTNNMNVANILAANPDCEVVVTGGSLRRTDGGLVGTLAVETIRQFKFDLAVVGCSALDQDGDLMDFDIAEVGVSQTILQRARQRIVVADHSKFARTAPVRIASLAEVEALVTDRPVSAPLAGLCRDWGTKILLPGEGAA